MTDANIVKSPDTLTNGRGFFSSADAPLPSDVLGHGAERVRIGALLGVAVWLYAVTMSELVPRLFGIFSLSKFYGTQERILIVVGLLASLGLWWAASRLRDKPGLVLDVGLVFVVVNSLIVSLIIGYLRDPRGVSWVCVTIVLWPAIAPSSPRKTLFAALAAASTIPFAIWYEHLANPGLHLPWFTLLWLILPGYVCAILAVAPATIIRRLGQQIGKARELGSYLLEEQIGKGGMGEIYRAKHRLLARPAAVKLISPTALNTVSHEANRVVIERFRREAEAAATLRSPHTIELYDYGVAGDGTFYYVMELLDGIDLSALVVRYGPIPAERVLHFIRQACDSLGEAHIQGLVHRDVKPSNILACRRMGLNVDYVKVLDFGLVKKDATHAGNEPELTAMGLVSGTPAFIAPESVAASEVGPPADVYALGCVAYWLLTGEHVFKATNAAMMLFQHMQALPVRPSVRTNQPIPVDLEDIVMRCLSKEPAERPANAVKLAQMLDDCRLPLVWTQSRALEWWQMHRGGISGAEKLSESVSIH